MKKWIALLLALVMVFSLCACGNDDDLAGFATSGSPPSESTALVAIEESNVISETSVLPTDEAIDSAVEIVTSTDNTASVITNDGETVEVSAQELFDVYDENEARFAKIYGGATIEFIGTVKNIKIDTKVYYGEGVASGQNKIVFEEGWCLIIGAENTTYDLADYDSGQKLKISSGIIGAAFDTEFLQNTADNNRVVWLVGSDNILQHFVNSQTTTITIVE